MFGGKNISAMKTHERKISSLTRQLQDISYQPQNPFREFAKFDGNVRIFIICTKSSLHDLPKVHSRLKWEYQ